MTPDCVASCQLSECPADLCRAGAVLAWVWVSHCVVQPSNSSLTPPASGLASGVTSPHYWGPSSNTNIIIGWDEVKLIYFRPFYWVALLDLCVSSHVSQYQPPELSRGWWLLRTFYLWLRSGTSGEPRAVSVGVWRHSDTAIESSIPSVISAQVCSVSDHHWVVTTSGDKWGLHSVSPQGSVSSDSGLSAVCKLGSMLHSGSGSGDD